MHWPAPLRRIAATVRASRGCSPDSGKAPHMETLLHFYAYGKPKETVEQTGPPQQVVVRVVKPW